MANKFTWAIVYVPVFKKPFCKILIQSGSFLDTIADRGLKERERFVERQEKLLDRSVNIRIYMLCGDTFFAHVSDIVELLNEYFLYLRTVINDKMTMSGAYTLCKSIFPPETPPASKPDVGIHALFSLHEIKYLTKSPAPTLSQYPIRLLPHKVMMEDVMRYN